MAQLSVAQLTLSLRSDPLVYPLTSDDYEGYEIIARRMGVLLPSNWFRVVWDWVLILFVLYNLVSLPVEICFLVGYFIPFPVRALNVCVDLFFISEHARQQTTT